MDLVPVGRTQEFITGLVRYVSTKHTATYQSITSKCEAYPRLPLAPEDLLTLRLAMAEYFNHFKEEDM